MHRDDVKINVLGVNHFTWVTEAKYKNIDLFPVYKTFAEKYRHSQWTQGDVRFTAVKAVHSDDAAIGVIIEAEGKKYYITGDTLYNTTIFEDIPTDIDYVFLPINGVGNNMNMADGVRFCKQLGATAIPLHCGLFDDLDLHDFPYENKIVPEFYREIKL